MEQVILVDDFDQVIGTADKESVHTTATPLHRAFSLFVFNANNELLITQRALTKKTFPGIWSNTVCGHPSPGETAIQAASRRVKEELRMMIPEEAISEVAPYRYRFSDSNGIVENEICPILIAFCYAFPRPNPNEIAAWKWMPWRAFLADISTNSTTYSPWCLEEARIIDRKKLPRLTKLK